MTTSEQTNFDEKKSKNEKLLDNVIEDLERTYPEQTADAMSDYVKILRMLSPISSDIRIKPIITMLKRLYIYPNRPEHNELLLEVHDLKEILHELRIDDSLSEEGLGDVGKPKIWPWLVVSAMAIIFIYLKSRP